MTRTLNPLRLDSLSNVRNAFCFGLALTTVCFVGILSATAQVTTQPREGLDKNPPAVFALKGATVHVDSKKTIDDATILVVRQRIVGVGDVQIPEGAQIIDLSLIHI